jgi:hypothetical protein
MHKIIALASLSGAVLCSYQMTCPKLTAGFYQVEFSGKAGEKMIGNYTLTDYSGKKPIRTEKVEGTLPLTVSFNSSEGYQVSAAALQYNAEDSAITTTISKDGVDCTHPLLVGSGTMSVVTCDP